MLFKICLATFLITAPIPANAVWHNTREVVLGTANTLEQGELIIGILMPAVYGITDDLMLTIHPISWALLSPNGSLRFRLVDEELIRRRRKKGIPLAPDEVGVPVTAGSEYARPPLNASLKHAL